MSMQLLIFLASLVALLYSADRLVESVVDLAKSLSISPMVIGLTVVAIGTSLPELMASVVAAYEGHPQIAVANVVGSNICNVGLIIAVPALFFSVTCSHMVLRREGMMMIGATVLFWVLCEFVGVISRLTGVLFIVGFMLFVYTAVKSMSSETEVTSSDGLKIPAKPLLMMLIALAVLLVSSKFLISSTIALAEILQVPEQVIAVSMVAFGTSLPELSVSFSAARRSQGDILIGNVLGSNISNLLLVLGATAVISPFSMESVTTRFDLAAVTLMALFMIYFLLQSRGINRAKAFLLLGFYVGFLLINLAVLA